MRKLIWLLLPASVLALDLGSKAWILRLLREEQSLPVIKGFFSLTLGFNRGAIFGSLTWLPDSVRYILFAVAGLVDRKSTRLNSSHSGESRMPSSA